MNPQTTENYIDLHVHSYFSDGTLSPTEILTLAKETKLKAIALTDHDSIDGIAEAKATATQLNIKFITGIEFSAQYKNREIHIVGLGFDHTAPKLQSYLTEMLISREKRNMTLIKNFKEIGIDIDYTQLKAISPKNIITRAHFANYLVAKKIVPTKDKAFQKYLSDNSPIYIKKDLPSVPYVTSLLSSCGGKAILAHPLLYGFNNNLEDEIKTLKTQGIEGIECMYPLNTKDETQNLLSIAYNQNLYVSGGSDFHGTMKDNIKLGTGKGNLKIPYSLIEKMAL